jgi:hypothetical protein
MDFQAPFSAAYASRLAHAVFPEVLNIFQVCADIIHIVGRSMEGEGKSLFQVDGHIPVIGPDIGIQGLTGQKVQVDIHYIRDLIETHPHIIAIKCSDPRQLAQRFIRHDFVLKVNFDLKKGTLLVETNNRDKFFSLLPELFVENDIKVEEITSPDDNLQAVFDYLIGK